MSNPGLGWLAGHPIARPGFSGTVGHEGRPELDIDTFRRAVGVKDASEAFHTLGCGWTLS